MPRRSPMIRLLLVLLATLQFASPGLSAVADGRLAVAAAAEQYAHIEESSSAGCPVAHLPDCAVCRYLSNSSDAPPAAGTRVLRRVAERQTGPAMLAWVEPFAGLPRGRAPPTV